MYLEDQINTAIKQVYKQAESLAKSRERFKMTPEKIEANRKYREEQQRKQDAYYQTEEGKKALEETAAFWTSYGEARAKGDKSIVSKTSFGADYTGD